jgi:hypothetical protein
MSVFDVELFEPINPGVSADSITARADGSPHNWTADGSPLAPATETSDAGINAHIYDVDLVEPVGHPWTADTIDITSDSIAATADGSPLTGAREQLDAEVIAVPVAIGEIYRRRPRVIEGVGYGALPRLVGEAHGVVYVAGGDGYGMLPGLTGEGQGQADDPLDLEILLLMLAA